MVGTTLSHIIVLGELVLRTIMLTRTTRRGFDKADGIAQIPPDLVVKSQAIDIIEVIRDLISG